MKGQKLEVFTLRIQGYFPHIYIITKLFIAKYSKLSSVPDNSVTVDQK